MPGKGETNMLDTIIKRTLIVMLALLAAAPVWAQRGQGRGMNGSGNGGTCCIALINSTPKQSLDPAEAAGLAYMREVEKLAHDVYAALGSKWGTPIFANIAQSESRHTNAIKLLLDKYGLPDPVRNNAAGVFQNMSVQTLYADLIRQGESSFTSALKVGATIEDLDIHDLEKAEAATDNNDLKLVYQNLKQGSENHMRAFVRQLAAAGETYAPQYIAPTAFSAIIANASSGGMGFGSGGNGPKGRGPGNKGVCPWR
jgi:hypothetical protein